MYKRKERETVNLVEAPTTLTRAGIVLGRFDVSMVTEEMEKHPEEKQRVGSFRSSFVTLLLSIITRFKDFLSKGSVVVGRVCL